MNEIKIELPEQDYYIGFLTRYDNPNIDVVNEAFENLVINLIEK